MADKALLTYGLLVHTLMEAVGVAYPEKPEVIRKAIVADMLYAAQLNGTWEPHSRERVLSLLAARENTITDLREELDKVKAENVVLSSQTRATLRAKLEHLGALVMEAVGTTANPVTDTQSIIRLRAALDGQPVYSRAQALEETLAIRSGTIKRHETALSAAQARIRELENQATEVAGYLAGMEGDLVEYARLRLHIAVELEASSEVDQERCQALGVKLGFLGDFKEKSDPQLELPTEGEPEL